jgi:hypothetical protein
MAVGLMAGTAVAADKISLGLGGYWRAAVHVGDTNNDAATGAAGESDFRNHGFGQESEIYFSGKTTLDNGIKFGVMVQLEGETSGDQMDNSYIWSEGAFGRVEYGETWGVSLMMSKGSVGDMLDGHGDFASQNGVVLPNGQFLDSYGGAAGMIATPEQKMSYYSPRMGGLQIGISYIPENNPGNNATGGGLNAQADGTIGSELVDVAANYTTKVGTASIDAFGSVFKSKAEAAAVGGAAGKDVDGYSVGAQVGISGFRVGGRYTKFNDMAGVGAAPIAAAAASLDRTSYRAGVDYGMGPWRVGVMYMHMEQQVAGPGVTRSARSDEVDYTSVGGSYNLGPGIKMFGGVQFYDAQDSANVANASPQTEASSTVGVIGTKLSF